MSDVKRKPVAGTGNTTVEGKEINNTWKLLLGFFILLSVVCVVWLANAVLSVSQDFTNFNQTIVLPALVFAIGALGIMFASYQLLKQRGGSERLLIEKETLRRRTKPIHTLSAQVRAEANAELLELGASHCAAACPVGTFAPARHDGSAARVHGGRCVGQ